LAPFQEEEVGGRYIHPLADHVCRLSFMLVNGGVENGAITVKKDGRLMKGIIQDLDEYKSFRISFKMTKTDTIYPKSSIIHHLLHKTFTKHNHTKEEFIGCTTC
jgi:hypothetical protein